MEEYAHIQKGSDGMTKGLRRVITVLVFVLFAVTLTGCRQKRPFHLQPSLNHPLHVNANSGEDDPDDTDVTVTPMITGDDYNLIAVRFYSVNASNATVRNSTVMEREDLVITPELILGYLIDSLEDESVTLSYNSVTMENGGVVIDFDDSIRRIAKSSAELENAVLDAAAQSILDNVEGCVSITYHINGGAYTTDNISFGYYDTYMDY